MWIPLAFTATQASDPVSLNAHRPKLPTRATKTEQESVVALKRGIGAKWGSSRSCVQAP